MSEIFARRLKEERERRGWTQVYMAELIGITNGALSGYERNYREPDLETLNKIARLLDVSVDYLLGRTNIRQIQTGPLAAHHTGPKGEDLSDLEDIIADAVKKAAKWREEKQKK